MTDDQELIIDDIDELEVDLGEEESTPEQEDAGASQVPQTPVQQPQQYVSEADRLRQLEAEANRMGYSLREAAEEEEEEDEDEFSFDDPDIREVKKHVKKQSADLSELRDEIRAERVFTNNIESLVRDAQESLAQLGSELTADGRDKLVKLLNQSDPIALQSLMQDNTRKLAVIATVMTNPEFAKTAKGTTKAYSPIGRVDAPGISRTRSDAAPTIRISDIDKDQMEFIRASAERDARSKGTTVDAEIKAAVKDYAKRGLLTMKR
jgi:hypothetical protein